MHSILSEQKSGVVISVWLTWHIAWHADIGDGEASISTATSPDASSPLNHKAAGAATPT